jgi:integrase
MAVYKRGKVYWYSFIFAGKRIQESAKTASKTVAKEAEKDRHRELERTLAGLPAKKRENRIRTVNDVIRPYLDAYELTHRPQSVQFAKGRLAHVQRLIGSELLPDLTESAIHSYVKARLREEASGRTINMEVGELSRAIGRTWRELWPKVKKLEERRDVGRALSTAEQRQLLDGLESMRSQALRTLIPTLLLTGMRAGEASSLRWSQVDLMAKIITVGRAKTSSGTGRVIPINDELAHILVEQRAWFVKHFGEPTAGYCVFPFGHPVPSDPRRHITDITWAWDELREKTGVRCRLHDLRHTFATGLAERGVPESTMLSLMGHMSRAMLERYSHIRMAAKRDAVAGVTLRPKRQNSEEVSTTSTTLTRTRFMQ